MKTGGFEISLLFTLVHHDYNYIFVQQAFLQLSSLDHQKKVTIILKCADYFIFCHPYTLKLKLKVQGHAIGSYISSWQPFYYARDAWDDTAWESNLCTLSRSV